jgi:PAS domain S-box-containing protein
MSTAVLTKGRNLDTPCYVGSVKSNIGHTESAAGVAGIIKASLSISKGAILPNIHFNKANPNIDFAGGRITVPIKLTPWLESGKPRMASVNSFGYGGTNGHIILQEYIPDQKIITTTQESTAIAHQPLCLIPLTAKTGNALKAVCKQLQDFLTSEQGKVIDLIDLNYSLAYRRSALDERLSLVVANTSELVEKLAAIINGDYPEGCSQQSADPEESLRMVFVFTGMGPQWWGMGKELYATEPVFKQKVDECDEIFTRLTTGQKVELLAPEEQPRMAKTCIAQPANFVIQVALLDLYHSWGIQLSAVVGHSVGEVASAYAAGALSLEDALLVSFHPDLYDRVSIAAVNSTMSVTLAEVLARIRTHLTLQQLKAQLKESEERLSRIIESAMDAIITLDKAGYIVLFNRAAERVLRCLAAEAIGGPCKRFLSEGLCRVVDGYVGQGRAGPPPPIWVPEGHTAVRADGEVFPVEATLSFAEANGQALYTVILRNIQERHRAEAERQRLLGLNLYLQENLIGVSPGLRQIMDKVQRVAATNATVLITGETGTGKEVIRVLPRSVLPHTLRDQDRRINSRLRTYSP